MRNTKLNPSEAVKEFHLAFGLPVKETPAVPDPKTALLRENLLEEEFHEYLRASVREDLVGIADALADMIYVIYGTALVYGIPLNDVFDEVHRSNMTKLDEYGQVIYRDDGKVLKGENYEPPNIAEIIKDLQPRGEPF